MEGACLKGCSMDERLGVSTNLEGNDMIIIVLNKITVAVEVSNCMFTIGEPILFNYLFLFLPSLSHSISLQGQT